MPRWLRGLLIGVVTGAFGVALALTPVGAGLERSVGLPWLFKVRGPIEPPPDVAVVAIDGTTGRALDLPKLPRDWPRTVHARLTDALIERGASVIVFDFDFSRPKPPEEDAAFARAIADAGRVVLLQRLAGRRQPVERADGSPGGWIWIEDALPPSEPLALAAKALGPFPLPKMGQAAFEFWSYKDSAGDAPTTAALALQLYALDADDGRWLAAFDAAGVPGLDGPPAGADDLRGATEVGDLMRSLRHAFRENPELRERLKRIAGDAGADDGRAREDGLIGALAALYAGLPHRYLNFYGPPGTIRTIPYQSLLKANGQPGPDLTGTVVFVGYSDLYDPEQPDRFYTVFTGSDGVDLSGVEIMATAFANLLTDRSLRIPEPATAISLLAAFGLAVGAGAYLLPAMVGVPVVFALAGLYAAGAQWAFNDAGLWLPVANPVLVQLPFALLVGLMGQYLLGRRRQRRMSEAISYYVPESIVRDLTEGGHAPDAVNKVVYGTCLATDMSGFSTIAEKMPPNELASFMNAYFDALAQALKRHAVDVTEFHADTIMCAWTAPAGPTAAVRRRAALAALEVVEAIERFGEARGGLRLSARIGLQDGHFYLGHTGGGGRLAYSILGDPANTAARLESLNKHLGTRVLAAGSVVEGADDLLLVRPLGSFRLMGRDDATAVVEVVARREAATAEQRELCAGFARALDAFRARRWSEAAGLFEAYAADAPRDGAAQLYLGQAQRYAADGPGDDGDPTVIRMGAK